MRSPVTTEEFSIEQQDKVFDPSDGKTLLYKCRNRTYYSNPITDLFYSGGCPVFYDFVTEYITDGSGNSLGKTEYEYRSEGTAGYGGNYHFPKTSLVVDLDWEWKFGQLLSKKVYKGNLNGGGISTYTIGNNPQSIKVFEGSMDFASYKHLFPDESYFAILLNGTGNLTKVLCEKINSKSIEKSIPVHLYFDNGRDGVGGKHATKKATDLINGLFKKKN